MKPSLMKDMIRYAKTKGRAPLDERQMNTLKDLYVELAKSMILFFMTFMIVYGYMERYGQETDFDYLNLAVSYLGTLTYYYLIRFCYQQVIGFDVNFEVLVIPALVFSPFLFMNTLHVIGIYFDFEKLYFYVTTALFPLYYLIIYYGANRVYQKGKAAQERQIESGELHFRSRKQITNYVIITIIVCAVRPISYDAIFKIGLLLATCMVFYMIWYYGFHTPQNEYILNEKGLIYTRALWNHKGGLLPYDQIERIEQRDTFNIGYSKDKVCILTKDGQKIMLYPENSYQFCVELENNL